MSTMRAWILDAPGGPEAFHLRERPVPEPVAGQVLIRVSAFGLNRSEWFTRIGDSPSVKLPRVLGIECVGEVESAPGGEYEKGQRVATMMGGMGREFDGSYAEFTCVPAANVFAIETSLDWADLGRLPEMLQTAHGSLHVGLGAQPGETILIRGGTSSIGLATLALAKASSIGVVTTTRSEGSANPCLRRVRTKWSSTRGCWWMTSDAIIRGVSTMFSNSSAPPRFSTRCSASAQVASYA